MIKNLNEDLKKATIAAEEHSSADYKKMLRLKKDQFISSLLSEVIVHVWNIVVYASIEYECL